MINHLQRLLPIPANRVDQHHMHVLNASTVLLLAITVNDLAIWNEYVVKKRME